MNLDETRARAQSYWSSAKSALETLCLCLMGVGALALVIHSWILLSNNNEKGAVGALLSVAVGAAGGVLCVEQWLAAAQGGLYLVGAAWGRADRSQCARMAGMSALVAAIWWALIVYGGDIALGFGFGMEGREATMRLAAFWLLLVNHLLRVPARLRITWLAVATQKAPESHAVTL